jgi:hypothetical protein
MYQYWNVMRILNRTNLTGFIIKIKLGEREIISHLIFVYGY